MRVRISDEKYVGDLIAFLEHAGYQVERAGANEIVTSPVPRSLRLERVRLELDLQLRAWEATHPGLTAERTIGLSGEERARRLLRQQLGEAGETEDRV